MTEETSLTDLLNAEPAEAVETVAEPVAEPGITRDENGRFAAKETGVPAEPETVEQDTTVPPTDKLPREEYKALKDEREKRQAIEHELADLRNQMKQFQQPEPQPIPSIWEDEQGYGSHIVQTAVQQATQQASLNAKLDMSEMMVRQSHEDFEDVKAEFLRLAAENPTLAQQALQDPHPWNKAYTIAKNHRAMQDMGAVNIDDLRAKLREEVLAELQSTPAEQRRLPPTLTGERSVAARSGPAWAGPASLSELLR